VNWTRVKRVPTGRGEALGKRGLAGAGIILDQTWPPEANAASSLRTPSWLPRITFSMLAGDAAEEVARFRCRQQRAGGGVHAMS